MPDGGEGGHCFNKICTIAALNAVDPDICITAMLQNIYLSELAC